MARQSVRDKFRQQLRVNEAKPLTIRDLDSLSVEELYQWGKSNIDALHKRRKRLTKAFEDDPVNVSSYGLHRMEDEGIPEVKMKMHKGSLKANVLKSEDLMTMKTGTVTGAKKVQDKMLRNAAGLPGEGRLNKKQRDTLNALKQDFNDSISSDEDLLRDFWNGFKHYVQDVAYKKYNPERELRDYRAIFNDVRTGGSVDMDELKDTISTRVRDEYEANQRKNSQLQKIGRRGGFANVNDEG